MDRLDKETRSRIMRAIRSKGNRSTELRFRMLLVRAGIHGWKMHPQLVVGNPDVAFPLLRMAVFVDGCFWHGCPKCYRGPSSNRRYWGAKIGRTRARDKRLRTRLRRSGWRILRVWEHDLSCQEAVLRRLRMMM
jgi:DNA mismatch endonuclease (patch repair protein)